MGSFLQRWRRLILSVIAALLAACTPISTPQAPSISSRPPEVSFLEAPEVVCSAATQIRLYVQSSEDLPIEAAGEWELRDAGYQTLYQGMWPVRDGALLIPFPDGRPLSSGSYTVSLRWNGFDLAEHTFTIGPHEPIIEHLTISLLPGTASLSEVPLGSRVVHVNYAYAGGCRGAPYWIAVRDGAGETVCSHHDILPAMSGDGTMTCHRSDGEPFAEGDYEAQMTLTEDVSEVVRFSVVPEAAPPTPTPSPSPTPLPPVVCSDPFVAAGITPEGKPFLPLEVFDWYTEVVYVGARCQHLQRGMEWRSRWYREGALVREEAGIWDGANEAMVWDSLTGVPENPFMLPGSYTVTLEINSLRWQAAFDVFAYESASPDE
ncbi:MAG: hypothetical protein ACP5HG_10385 [Anaerolineae bacterium]